MLQGEHSATLSTFIKLPFVNNIFILSIFEWPLKTGFTVILIDFILNFYLCKLRPFLRGARASMCRDSGWLANTCTFFTYHIDKLRVPCFTLLFIVTNLHFFFDGTESGLLPDILTVLV